MALGKYRYFTMLDEGERELKRFHTVSGWMDKRNAMRLAKETRAKGNYARVVPSTFRGFPLYVVYERKRR